MNRIIATITAILIAVAVLHSAIAAPIDPTDGILSDSFLGTEDNVFTATMAVKNRETRAYETFHISFENTYGTLPVNGHTDVYTQTSDSLTFFQNGVTYTAAIYVPTQRVMLAIAGQTGDTAFDATYAKLDDICTILIVVDNASDTTSPYIYTRLACNMTQAQIDNAPESINGLLSITPLYQTMLPIVVAQ